MCTGRSTSTGRSNPCRPQVQRVDTTEHRRWGGYAGAAGQGWYWLRVRGSHWGWWSRR